MSVEKSKLVVTRYQIPSGECISCRIALVSDLHDRPADRVLALLRQEHPDLIIAAGDMMERCTEGMSPYTKEEMDAWQGITKDRKAVYPVLKVIQSIGNHLHVKDDVFDEGLSFLTEAAKIAPVFYGMGNHEWYFLPSDEKAFAEHGIQVLDNRDILWDLQNRSVISDREALAGELSPEPSQELTEKRQNFIRIGGLSTRYDLEWLDAYAGKSGCKILICHHPEYYRKYIRGTDRDRFTLILSGHVHGGQWRIGKHGVLAPGQGLFPEYCHGVYDQKLVVGAGLANTASIPRFGNPTELVMVELGHAGKAAGVLPAAEQ